MAIATNDCGRISYLGHFPRVVDGSHRLLLPIEWRPKGAPTKFTLLLWPLEKPECLVALPPERWELFWKKWEEMPVSAEESAKIERMLCRRAFVTALDQFGRLPLPEPAATGAGIRKTAELIGRNNKFEIWSPEKFNATVDSPETLRLAQALKQIRI